MKYSKSVQKQKERHNKWKAILSSLVLLSFSCVFLIVSIQNFLVLRGRETDVIVEYQGQYKMEIKENWRNHNYVFTLSNGERIEIRRNDLLKFESLDRHVAQDELVFRYSKYAQPIRNTHTPLSIVSSDRTTTYLEESAMKDEIRQEMVLCATFGCLCLVLSVFLSWNEIGKLLNSLKPKRKRTRVK